MHHLPDHHWWTPYPNWHNRPWWSWWNAPAWGEVNVWFGGWGWTQPVYYNYGPQGNVVYENQTVYVDGNPVGSGEEYVQSARKLADVAPKESEQDDQSNWLSLGTFALSEYDAHDAHEPTETVQLAVDKEGVISGILFDLSQNTSLAIHGSVDKATQRVAFTLSEGLVAETGMSNLTMPETSLLVYQGDKKKTLYRLTRLQAPSEHLPQPFVGSEETGEPESN